MKCKECGGSMYIDDRERRFKGNEDIYWNCTECQTSCIEEIRFGQRFRELWHSENNNRVKDYAIKYKIVKGGKL